MTRVVLCTAKYSDNLGDGVISDSVEYLLKFINPACKVVTLDVSGRTHYDNSDSKDTTIVKKVFLNTPEILRPLVTLAGWFFIFKPRLGIEIKRLRLENYELLIFGGGQLINDISLNFPLKLAFIAKQARLSKLKYTFNAVGVGQKISPLGKKLFNSIFNSSSLSSIYVRDEESRQRFNDTFSSPTSPLLTIDSGLWAKECYNINMSERTGYSETKAARVGLGISHPKELAVHSVGGSHERKDMVDFWVRMVNEVLDNGLSPVLFTNGSRDDNEFMTLVIAKLDERELLNDVDIFERFKTPDMLVKAISTLSGVVSHRLHANIISHSLNVPSIALAWDKKVQSYFDLIDRSDWCYSDTLSPALIIDGLVQAMELGLNQQKIDELKMISVTNLKQQMENN